jgi:hypothetical protein
MLRFKNIPWLSIILLLLTYSTFGWIYADWAIATIQQGNLLNWVLDRNLISFIVYGLGVVWVLLVSTAFTAPIALMTISVSSWIRSEARAFLSIFIGALAFALIVQWLDAFTRFFVLLAAAILVKLDLQTAGYSRWLSVLILAILCLAGFGSGILAFYYLSGV